MQLRGATQSYTRSRRRIAINITSLIDVLFLLLIFFMVSSTFLEQPGMELELPSAESANVSKLKSYVVYLYADGEIHLNEHNIEMRALEDSLKRAETDMKDMTLSLFADKGALHGNVVQIMDIARKAGIQKLVIATLPAGANK